MKSWFPSFKKYFYYWCRQIMKFTRGPAKMEPKVDGVFELYGGKIQGKNLELVRGIEWEWKGDRRGNR